MEICAGRGQHGKKQKDDVSGLLSPAIQLVLKDRIYCTKETQNVLLQLCFLLSHCCFGQG